ELLLTILQLVLSLPQQSSQVTGVRRLLQDHLEDDRSLQHLLARQPASSLAPRTFFPGKTAIGQHHQWLRLQEGKELLRLEAPPTGRTAINEDHITHVAPLDDSALIDRGGLDHFPARQQAVPQ